MKMWTDTKKAYDLGNGYQLKRADFADFGIHYAIYGNRDEDFQYSFTKRSQDTVVMMKIVFLLQKSNKLSVVL